MTSNPDAFDGVFSDSGAVPPIVDFRVAPARRAAIRKEVRSEIKGLAVGLFGFPNSGKTSFLYSLKYGASKEARSGTHAKGQRSWILGPTGVDFARLVGTPGEPQVATPAGVFKVAEFCSVTRVLIPGTSIGRSRMIFMPEVSGEVAKSIVDGKAEQYAEQAEKYFAFLAECDTLLCLVGLDGSTAGGSNRSIRPDSAIKPALEGFERIVAEVLKRRRSKTPLAVSVLITKVDLLKEGGALDEVTVMASQSALAALARTKPKAWLAPMVLSGEGDEQMVHFRVNALMSVPQARGDLDVQEAITADFLRCHAPSSAKSLSGFCKLPGVSVRFFLSAPYGRHFIGTTGENLMPAPDDLKTRMVYEPLEDALERAWAAQSGRRLRRKIFWSLVASLVLFLLGPYMLGRFESSFDAVVVAKAPLAEIRAELDWIEWHPLFGVEQSLSSAQKLAHATRLLEFRTRMESSGVNRDHKDIYDLEDRALGLNPNAQLMDNGVNVPLKALVAERSQRALARFLQGGTSIDEIGKCQLTADAVLKICDVLKSFPVGVDPQTLIERGKRIQVVIDALGASESLHESGPSLQCSGGGASLMHALTRAKALVSVRIARDTYSESTPLTPAQKDALLLNVLLSGDLASGKWFDDQFHKELRREWQAAMPKSSASVAIPPFRDSLKSMRSHGWRSHLLQQEAQRSFEAWILEIGNQSTVSFDARPLNIAAAHATASAYLAGAMSEIHALDSGGESWIVEPIRKSALPLVEQAARRSRLLAGLTAARLDGSVGAELGSVFKPEKTVEVSWDSQTTVGDRSTLSFTRLYALQQERVKELLCVRISAALVADRIDDAAEIMAILAKVADENDNSLVVFAALLDIAKEAKEKTPNVEKYERALARILEMENGLALAQSTLADRLAAAPALSELLPVTLESLNSSRVSGPSKRAWAKDFFASIGKRLGEVDAKSLETTVIRMSQLGFPLNEILPSLLVESLSHVKEDQSKEELERRSDQVFAVLKGAAQAAPGSDYGVSLLGPLLVDVKDFFERAADAKDFRQGEVGRRTLDFLLRLEEQHVASEELQVIAQALRRHALLIDKNSFIKVQRDGVAPFWLSPKEWDLLDVQRLAKSEPSRFAAWANKPSDQPIKKPHRFKADGSASKDLLQESDSSLGLENVQSAQNLMKLAGLRLPTRLEWVSVAPNIARLEFKLPDEHPNCWRADTAALIELGDRSIDGFIGLQFGVREWVDGFSYPLCGRSNATKRTTPQSDGIPLNIDYDCGVRPALDALPVELRNALSRPSSPQP